MPADLTPEKALDEIRALIDPILDDQRSADDDYEIAMQAGEIDTAERVRAILARVTPSETDGSEQEVLTRALLAAPELAEQGGPNGDIVFESDLEYFTGFAVICLHNLGYRIAPLTPTAVPGAGEVERVARALAAENGTHHRDLFDAGTVSICDKYRHQARAAITALRDGETL